PEPVLVRLLQSRQQYGDPTCSGELQQLFRYLWSVEASQQLLEPGSVECSRSRADRQFTIPASELVDEWLQFAVLDLCCLEQLHQCLAGQRRVVVLDALEVLQGELLLPFQPLLDALVTVARRPLIADRLLVAGRQDVVVGSRYPTSVGIVDLGPFLQW